MQGQLFPHSHMIEERAGTGGVGVRESCRARLSYDVSGERKERWLRSQVGVALKEVIQTAHGVINRAR